MSWEQYYSAFFFGAHSWLDLADALAKLRLDSQFIKIPL